MLSRALRSSSSPSLASGQLAAASAASNMLLSNSMDGSDYMEHATYSSPADDGGQSEMPRHDLEGADEDVLLFDEDGDSGGLTPTLSALSLHSSATASLLGEDGAQAIGRRADQPLFVSAAAKPPFYGGGIGGGGSVAIPQPAAAPSAPNPFANMARSCPKPIVMPRRARHSGLHDADELSVFVPPHELVSSSVIDPSNVAESLSRKGSAALRLRAGVLRRTGYLDGHTETLRAAPASSSFKP